MEKTIIKTFPKSLGNGNFFCLLFCIWFWSCGNKNASEFPNIVENKIYSNILTTQQKKNLTTISFENSFHNFGNVAEGEKLSYTFHLKNIGPSNLIINSVDASCGCTASIFTQEPIRVGDEEEITVTLDTKGKSGHVANHLVISANTHPAQTVLLIHANVVSHGTVGTRRL